MMTSIVEEAEYWWTSTKRRIEANGDAITWVRFRNEFLKKYFPEDLRNKKEAKFLNLKHMDVIFGMDWMLTFGVNINCLTKSVTFSKLVEGVGGKFLTAEQVKKSLDGEASVFMMFASLKGSGEKGVGDLPAVQEFQKCFRTTLSTYRQRGKLS